MSGTITYDYPALKEAHGKLTVAIEQYEAVAKQTAAAGDELVEGNNAEGVKSTMTEFAEKNEAIVKIMRESLELMTSALANAKELHDSNGGVE